MSQVFMDCPHCGKPHRFEKPTFTIVRMAVGS